MLSFRERAAMFLRRVIAFVLPKSGWKKRIQKYKAGQTSWQIPGAPADSTASVGPWPIEWTPCNVELVRDDEGVLTGAKLKFFDFHSYVSGRWAEGEDAVACARCGVYMHVADTEMETNLDVPLCPWCVRVAE